MVLLPLWVVAAALLGARAAAGRQVSERESERPARRLRRSPALPSRPRGPAASAGKAAEPRSSPAGCSAAPAPRWWLLTSACRPVSAPWQSGEGAVRSVLLGAQRSVTRTDLGTFLWAGDSCFLGVPINRRGRSESGFRSSSIYIKLIKGSLSLLPDTAVCSAEEKCQPWKPKAEM
ncbi:hypothetical protein CIB84_015666 [Bambusicola thoracicus]|uniref:Uncharacterized protein n=1 Tax=Bambusicola thoracicus TaxID=9083 RepID=A0A2P4S909_BAMTH|nr:hypothetical protein CIB84_015666 [Bambusicola thoracicus]